MLKTEELKRLEKIEKIQAKNDLFLQICVTYLNECERLVTKEMIDEITAGDRSLDSHAFSAFLSSAFIENQELEAEMHREYFVPSIKKLNPDEYRNNPYFKNIKIFDTKIGSWTLSYQKYAPYEGFVRDDFALFDNFKEVCKIGFFDEEFSFPTVFENGVEWMAIKPNEIETMKEPIEKASGRVIAFGLGLGYFAYMASIKNEVSSVTVIEKSKDVIDLFNLHILPHFSHPEKITVIQSDAFDYAREQMPKEKYDYAFVDLWHDTSDGVELYIKMKKLEVLSKHTHFQYWIEKSILVTVRKRIFGAIMQSIEKGKNNLSYDEIINRISFDYLKEFVKFI